MTAEEQVAIWVSQAEYDLRAAAANASSFPAHAAVLCEQAAEKFLKALWIYRNRKGPPRHHRLGDLAVSLAAPEHVVRAGTMVEPDYIAARDPDAALVTPYTRYDQEVAERRFEAAEEVAAWVRRTLAEEGWA